MSAGPIPSPGPGPDGAPLGRVDLVTVVYGGELGLLTLQARSIARFLPEGAVGQIIVIVNDRDEARVRAAVAALAPAYGPHAPRLRIVSPDTLLAGGGRGPVDRLRGLYLRHLNGRRRLARARRTGAVISQGWRGNNGWSMQQAMKLRAARLVRAGHVILLDARNHFTAPFRSADWIAPDGRPICAAAAEGRGLEDWRTASQRALGLAVTASPARMPNSITPFVLTRGLFLEALERIEARLGPVALLFGLKRRGATEFMLLFAIVEAEMGGWWRYWQRGTHSAVSAFTRTEPDRLAAVIETREAAVIAMLGIHRRLIEASGPRLRGLLTRFWLTRGLIAHEGDWPGGCHGA